ncbi:hypothetical protein D3P09_04885 [Paenibacillus pinisoli]|uniref:Uncharacterized protein n=1 Tax=Paenibacillus pinisoli TaxID=1276110 RepID=A0A3A6PWV6_9BACL|nr:hypothetical protein [Paenibacillus pinisoli]RJX41321.1 hypothetical protein D3P09_04885 [Paenibacillus pinisoli]
MIDSDLIGFLYNSPFSHYVVMQALVALLFAFLLSGAIRPRFSPILGLVIAILIPLALGLLMAIDVWFSEPLLKLAGALNWTAFDNDDVFYFSVMLQLAAGLIFLKPWNNRASFITGTLYSSIMYFLIMAYLFALIEIINKSRLINGVEITWL